VTNHWSTAPRGEVIRLEHHSRLLERNPLGDAATRELAAYLPPGHDLEPTRRYPVIWVLAGYTGTGGMLENQGAWSPPLSRRMDQLIAAGCPPVILALPDCFTRLGGSQYLDSSATGPYRSYLLEELVPLVDARFPTLPHRDHRGVMGKSSGGYGALCLGLEAADTFGAVACHSGDMYFEPCYGVDFPRVARAIPREEELLPWLERLERQEKREWTDLSVLNILCMAACYSPSESRPPPLALDLPFELHTCEIRPQVFARWLARDPVRMLEDPACQEALRSLHLLYVDCGLRDEFHLQFGARILARRLRELGLPHQHEEFDDGHRSLNYRYDRSLPLLARALSPAGSA